MLLVVWGILILLTIILLKINYDEDVYMGLIIVLFIIVGCILFIFTTFNINHVLDSKVIDAKINTYEIENQNIENDVNIIVKNYLKHEQNTFDMSKIKSSTTLIQMYPELKSNELVKTQIKIYNSNNKKIKELKINKINYEKSKWWLYFGGNF